MRSSFSNQHQFSQVPQADIQRSTFNRSHQVKTTFNAGYLVPILVDEALPGDTFKCRLNAFGRLATPKFPFMDNVVLDFFFFAVPNRLVWSNWEKFCGAQDAPDDSTDYLIPQTEPGLIGYPSNEIHDYMGLPVGVTGFQHSALWLRAYNLIYNTWFRSQDLDNPVVVNTDDGPDAESDYTLLRTCKRHDYFTSCLPWPQKGDAVELPLGTSAPIKAEMTGNTGNFTALNAANQPKYIFSNGTYAGGFDTGTPAGTAKPLFADLSNATAATINSLRQAFQIQRLLERNARGGTRYVEILKSHFKVTSPDYRLQRPELLAIGSANVNTHPVPQTSQTDASPQGNLAAFSTVGMNGTNWEKSFVEHSLILGFCRARADLSYQQGLNRMWSRRTRYDFYWPSLANLGEQAVLSKEIYLDGTPEDENVFGYQERWAEMRYKPTQITGLFRSNNTLGTPLDVWHLAQNFASRPTLGPDFVKENPPIERVIAITEEPHFLLDAVVDYQATRPMPTYSVPGMIDHF